LVETDTISEKNRFLKLAIKSEDLSHWNQENSDEDS